MSLKLYLIEILHQTTTRPKLLRLFAGCILSKFYIKPQPDWRSCDRSFRCILSKFYIKPQQQRSFDATTLCCILSKFYIKPQHERSSPMAFSVVSYRNSTSNHNSTIPQLAIASVVSYRNSTSNHNLFGTNVLYNTLYLIEILHQTTTGNRSLFEASSLYLIEILHQTTTAASAEAKRGKLYLIEILHQTTTSK